MLLKTLETKNLIEMIRLRLSWEMKVMPTSVLWFSTVNGNSKIILALSFFQRFIIFENIEVFITFWQEEVNLSTKKKKDPQKYHDY